MYPLQKIRGYREKPRFSIDIAGASTWSSLVALEGVSNDGKNCCTSCCDLLAGSFGMLELSNGALATTGAPVRTSIIDEGGGGSLGELEKGG